MITEYHNEIEIRSNVEDFDYAKAFQWLVSHGDRLTVKNWSHTNWYYDTSDCEFEKEKTSVRLRISDTIKKLEVKTKTSEKNECLERKMNLPRGIIPRVIKLGDRTVYLQGSLITERNRFTDDIGNHIDIDKNTYLGITDYDIEIEIVTVEQDPIIGEFIGYMKLVNQSNTEGCGKHCRFMDAYRNMPSIAIDEL